MILSFALLFVAVTYVYDAVTRFSRTSMAGYFPQSTSLYVRLPEEILDTRASSRDALVSFLGTDLASIHSLEESYGISLDGVLSVVNAADFGLYDTGGSSEFLAVLDINPEGANVLLNTLRDEYDATSDGLRGSLKKKRGDIALYYGYHQNMLFVSSEPQRIDAVFGELSSDTLAADERFNELKREGSSSDGLFFVRSQQLYSLIEDSQIPLTRYVLPFLIESRDVAATFDYFSGGVRMHIMLPENTTERQSAYYDLIRTLPSSTLFYFFGEYPSNPGESVIDTGINMETQYQLLSDELIERYGFDVQDEFFQEVLKDFIVFGIPGPKGTEVGVRYPVADGKIQEHIILLEEKIAATLTSERVEERELELSDGTVATELFPKELEVTFEKTLTSDFRAPVERLEDGRLGQVFDQFVYDYTDGIMTVMLRASGGEVFEEARSNLIISESHMSYVNAKTSGLYSGAYLDLEADFLPFSLSSFSDIAAYENEDSVDILLYENSQQ